MRAPLLRSILFVPGSRPDRFGKALASGADAVCLDLEDGVAPGDRERAREAVTGFLAEDRGEGGGRRPALAVRVSHPETPPGRRDLEALAGVSRPDLVMIPKAEGAADVEAVSEGLGAGAPPGLLPLVETPRGLAGAEALAEVRGVEALVFGGLDLAAALGARAAWEPLLYARSRMVHAAALGGVGAVDVPWTDLEDPEGLEAETRRAAALGFTGKLAIHPAQIEPIHRGMAPRAAEVERARRIVEADARAGGGVAVVDGRMVDRPVVEGARKVLARAEAGAPDGADPPAGGGT